MEFRKCSIAGKSYGDVYDEDGVPLQLDEVGAIDVALAVVSLPNSIKPTGKVSVLHLISYFVGQKTLAFLKPHFLLNSRCELPLKSTKCVVVSPCSSWGRTHGYEGYSCLHNQLDKISLEERGGP